MDAIAVSGFQQAPAIITRAERGRPARAAAAAADWSSRLRVWLAHLRTPATPLSGTPIIAKRTSMTIRESILGIPPSLNPWVKTRFRPQHRTPAVVSARAFLRELREITRLQRLAGRAVTAQVGQAVRGCPRRAFHALFDAASSASHASGIQ